MDVRVPDRRTFLQSLGLDQVTTHYLSPNPEEGGLARATWRHSRDTSTVWAAAVAQEDSRYERVRGGDRTGLIGP